MEIDLILNELSLQNIAPNEEIAKQWMSELIKTIRSFTAQGVKVSLRSKENFHTIMLAPNYPVRRWFNDADQRERVFIKALATKAPLSVDIANSEVKDIENSIGLAEFFYQGRIAIGLAVAHLLDTIAISFISNECWNFSHLDLEARRLNENGEVIEDIVEILHASRINHVQEHTDWIQNRIRIGVIDGADLWERREILFPNLEFCDAVEKQFINIRPGQLELQPVVKTLLQLQKCCQYWTNGGFSVEGHSLDESGESESTRNNNRYRNERTFLCPDGEVRFFDRHVKLKFCNWRIHFFPLKPGTVIIGYVGRHLSTVKYKT